MKFNKPGNVFNANNSRWVIMAVAVAIGLALVGAMCWKFFSAKILAAKAFDYKSAVYRLKKTGISAVTASHVDASTSATEVNVFSAPSNPDDLKALALSPGGLKDYFKGAKNGASGIAIFDRESKSATHVPFIF